MTKPRFNRWTLTAVCAVLAIVAGWGMSASHAKSPASTSPAQPDLDLSAEINVLNSYVKDLRAFDKKCGQLNKRDAFTAVDLDPLQRNADELKGRISSVQNALREAIRKLKAAGRWDGLDEVVAGITESPSKELLRQESFKRVLEESTSQLSDDSRQILNPIDILRKRLKAQLPRPGFENGATEVAWHAVPANYLRTAEPVVMNIALRCRFALLRQGLSAAAGIHDSTGHLGSQESLDDARCYCAHDFGSCDFAAN